MKRQKAGFYITGKKGFHFAFDNGWVVSVQFGPGNYCENHDLGIGEDEERAGAEGSASAECAVWKGDNPLFAHPSFDNDTVGGYFSPEQVLDLLNWAASQDA